MRKTRGKKNKTKNMTVNGTSIFLPHFKHNGLVERKNEILKQQIKLLISKITLGRWTAVLT